MKTNRRRTFLHTSVFGSLGLVALPQFISKSRGGAPKKRILVAHFSDETNTFINEQLTLNEVKKRALFGNDFLHTGGMVHGTVGTALDGFVDCAEMYNVDLIGSIFVPGNHRIMTEEVFDFVMGHILDSLDKHEVDGVYLSAHGAGCTIGHDDLEGEAMQMIRKKVGPDIPIAFTMDLHCTITKLMAEVADIVSVYRTYPHIDAFETGYEAASIMMATLFGKVKPVLAMRKIPLMIGPPINVLTAEDPMRQVYQRAKELQRTVPGILSCCPAHGFMQQDVPEQGAGVIVTCDGDRGLAQKVADEVANLMCSFREQYWIDLPGPAETIEMAKKAERPVAISDSGDNIGAGGAGDGTHLLQEILRQGVRSAFIQLYDPISAKKAFDAGVGATISLEVGSRSSPLYGSPVPIKGKVTKVSEVNDSWHQAARVEVDNVTLLLNTKRIGPDDQANVRGMGIYPEKYQMCVCKGGFAFRPQYPPSIYDYILSATPGFSSPDLSTFEWKRIPRPIYPLDKI
ncbi:MAG: M81 family metallopeptidase [Saprospiraceae bacterium]|nr:M81 family metallopeptidase [Saprospiraceae bacterium]